MCKDFDLCSDCFVANLLSRGEIHDELHLFIAINRDAPFFNKEIFPLALVTDTLPLNEWEVNAKGLPKHPGVKCDTCKSEIWGCRYKCAQCDNFDLCPACFSAAGCGASEQHAGRFSFGPGLPAQLPVVFGEDPHQRYSQNAHFFVLLPVPFPKPSETPKKLFSLHAQTLLRREIQSPFSSWPCYCCLSSQYGLIPSPSFTQSVRERKAIPLQHVEVNVDILEFLAEVTIQQTYVNTSSDPIEATYTFPLDDKAAIHQYIIEIDGKNIVGQVEESMKAKDKYDDAIASGHGAYLIEQDEEMIDVFTCHVGNLPPRKLVKITIVYITELSIDGTESETCLNFSLPTAVGPRYVPNTHRKDSASPSPTLGILGEDSHWLGLPEIPTSSSLLNIKVQMKSGSGILCVKSVTNSDIQVLHFEGERVEVVYEGQRLEKNFLLSFVLKTPHVPRIWKEVCTHLPKFSGKEEAFMTVLYPNLKNVVFHNDTLGEFIFVIDRSGSMSGSRINAARSTLLLCLAALPDGALFNIVGFGSSFEFLFGSSSVRFDNTQKKVAVTHCQTMQANLGGTEILGPLQKIFLNTPLQNHPRQIFLLTDGEVSNTREIKDFVKEKNLKTGTRFFCFGIGSSCSQVLVNSIAKAGGGKSEFIFEAENMQAKVLRQLDFALSPILTGVQINWGSISLSSPSTPAYHSPLFHGNRLLSFVFSSCFSTPDEVKVVFTTPDGQQCDTLKFSEHGMNTNGHLVHIFATKSLLNDLEEKYEQSSSLVEKEEVKREAVHLSKLVSVSCRWTSFVGIETRRDPITSTLVPVKVPMSIVKDSDLARPQAPAIGSLFGSNVPQQSLRAPPTLFGACASPAPTFGLMPQTSFGYGASSMFGASRSSSFGAPSDSMNYFATPPLIPITPFSNSTVIVADVISSLAALQNTSGSWDLTHDLCALVGKDLASLQASSTTHAVSEESLATVLVLFFLSTKQGSRQEEWKLFDQKAQKWLSRTLGEHQKQRLFGIVPLL